MMTAVYIWMSLSAFATCGIVSSMALGARRHIPTIDTETSPESMILLNRGGATARERKLATSLAQ